VEATEEDGDDALGTAALPPQPLPPSTMLKELSYRLRQRWECIKSFV
jgi:hypothetical protein